MLPEACIWVTEIPAQKTGYVDLNDLRQCLDLYFRGHLDEVDLTRLWRPADQLNPGNTLEGQLDADTMRRCLFALPEANRTAIAHYYEPDCPDLNQTLAHWFVHSSAPTLAEYIQQLYVEGILMLAEVVHRAL